MNMTRGRRGNHEGSVWQRKDGRWVAAYHDGAGRRVQHYARTRVGAAEKLADGLKLQLDRVVVPTEKQTVGQYLTEWLENSARRTVRPMTFVSYESIVRQHLIPELGSIPLARLAPQEVQRLLNAKSDSGLSPRRVAYIRAVLRRALREALEWGLVTRNAAALVRPPKVERFEIRPLDPEQARTFLKAIRGDRLEALYTVALAVGLRAGEALGLCWEDVDLDHGELCVRRALQKIDGEWRLVEPKTPRSRRTVSLPAVTVGALREHQQRQAVERERAREMWADQWGLVFTTPLGTPLDNANVTHRFQRHLATAGLPHQRFHDLRHACASLLLAQGVNPRVVMEVLGHSQVTLTLDTYSHVIPALGREAAAQMDDVLSDSKGDA
jgi:integrase